MKVIFCLLATILIGSAHLHAQGRGDDDNDVVRNGNKFEMTGKARDTFCIVDPIDGHEIMRVTEYDMPARMNGKKIYKLNEVTTPPKDKEGSVPLEEYLINAARKSLASFSEKDCPIRIDVFHVIVDENGKIVYWDEHGTSCLSADRTMRRLGDPFRDKLDKILANAPLLEPATVNGKNVTAYASTFLFNYRITVQGKNVTFVKDKNETNKHCH